MLEIVSKGVVRLVKTHVLIGSKHLYKYVGMINQGTGEYYEVLPNVDTRVQNAILKLGKPSCQATKTPFKQHLKTYLTSIKCFLGLGKKWAMLKNSWK